MINADLFDILNRRCSGDASFHRRSRRWIINDSRFRKFEQTVDSRPSRDRWRGKGQISHWGSRFNSWGRFVRLIFRRLRRTWLIIVKLQRCGRSLLVSESLRINKNVKLSKNTQMKDYQAFSVIDIRSTVEGNVLNIGGNFQRREFVTFRQRRPRIIRAILFGRAWGIWQGVNNFGITRNITWQNRVCSLGNENLLFSFILWMKKSKNKLWRHRQTK